MIERLTHGGGALVMLGFDAIAARQRECLQDFMISAHLPLMFEAGLSSRGSGSGVDDPLADIVILDGAGEFRQDSSRIHGDDLLLAER